MALKVARGIASLPTRYRFGLLFIILVSGIILLAPQRESTTFSLGLKVEKVVPQTLEGRLDQGKPNPVSAHEAVTSASEKKVEKTAKIVTCPRCRLNSLPSVKKFVYEHAPFYKHAMKVDFIIGEDPVLYLYEDGKEVERIKLETYDWKKIVRKLASFGIRPSSETKEIREALQSSDDS